MFFCFSRLLEDSTPVPKYVCVDTCPGLYFVICILFYRVIHKSLLDFRPLRYSSRDGHAEGEHVNRGRVTPSYCHTLQVLDVSTLGDAAMSIL